MRIMLGVHQFPPDFYAGTEKLTFDTARELLKRGHAVRVFTSYAHPLKDNTPPYFDQYEYKGIAVDRYFYSRRDPLVSRNNFESAYNNPRASDGFARSVAAFSPDIVHFYHLQRLSGSVINVCMANKIPTILTATDYWIVCPTHQLYMTDHSICSGPDDPPANCLKHLCRVSPSNRLRMAANVLPEFILRKLMRKCARYEEMSASKPIAMVQALIGRNDFLKKRLAYVDKVLVATQFMRDILTEWGISPSKIFHLPFSIPEIDHERSSRESGEKELRIGFIGTLYDYKGAHVLLESIRKIPREVAIKVKVYGELKQFPAYVEKLRKIAGDDPRIMFCGTFEPDRIGEVLRDLDLLAVPSIWHENTPLVIHAALGAGVPVLGSDVSGVNEIIRHESNGILFERGNAGALAAVVERLVRDPRLLKKLTGSCKPPASMSSYIDQLEHIYDSVCGENRERSLQSQKKQSELTVTDN